MSEVAVKTEPTPQMLFAQFQAGRVLVERSTRLTTEMDELYTRIREDASWQSYGDDTFTPVEGSIIPEDAATYVSKLLARNTINAEVDHQSAAMNRMFKYTPVRIRPIRPTDKSPLTQEGYRHLALTDQSWTEVTGRPSEIQGTIYRVDVKNNRLLVMPRKFTLASSDAATFHAPMLDEYGHPAVAIEFKEPTFRDQRPPGKLAKIRKEMFGF